MGAFSISDSGWIQWRPCPGFEGPGSETCLDTQNRYPTESDPGTKPVLTNQELTTTYQADEPHKIPRAQTLLPGDQGNELRKAKASPSQGKGQGKRSFSPQILGVLFSCPCCGSQLCAVGARLLGGQPNPGPFFSAGSTCLKQLDQARSPC